jgi:VWFA-related protein
MSTKNNGKLRIRVAALLAAGLVCAIPLAMSSQEQQAPPPPQAAPPAAPQPGVMIKKESKLVLVDAVVTDKKGNYVHDLSQADFKVFEDNKAQQVSSFSAGVDAAAQANGQRRYLILFFDNSTMAMPDQIQARGAAKKFIEANAGPDRMMAVVDFGGSLRIVQNFTANANLLQAAVSGVKTSSVDPNAPASDVPVTVASAGLFSLGNAAADFGARSMLLAIRSLAKNLRSIPGRKMVVLFSGGFPLTSENQSELTATIDACNKSNVAVYALDARGLTARVPGGSARRNTPTGKSQAVSNRPSNRRTSTRPRILLAAFPARAVPDPQRPGGGGGGGDRGGGGGGDRGGGGGGGRGGGGGTGGGGTGGGGRGGGGGTGGTGGGTGGAGGGGRGGGTGGTGGGGRTGGGTGGGTGGTTGGTRGGYLPGNYNTSPYSQPRTIVPQFPTSASSNQQILAALAEGTGGFTIFNTNDLLGGLERIGREQNEFYILGYVPADTPEGSCHTIKVKLNRGGLSAPRSRSGYCNTRSTNVLEGKPLEKQLETRAASSQTGSIHGALQAPYFYTAPNTARVNLAMELPPDTVQFNKEKGKYHANLNVLGIAYRPDGTIGAKFSDTVNMDLEKDEWKDFTKTPYHYENQFDAVPGTYKLTVVLSAGGDTFGKFERPLTIDEYDGKHFSLSGLALASSVQKLTDIPTGLDSVLLEDRTPLVVKGMQITPSGSNRFKHTDNVVVYTEIYEPLLASANPPLVGMAYTILERESNKKLFFTDVQRADDFVQKGNPVIPIGLKVKVNDLKPGSYRLVMQAVDSAKNNAPSRIVDFDIAE